MSNKREIINGEACCGSCKEWKPVEDFPKNKSDPLGIYNYCRICANERARNNHKKIRAKGKEGWDKHRKTYRSSYYKRIYGITLEEFETKLENQDFKCAICRVELDIDKDSRKAHLDHCHESGKIRDILCVCCNKGIGYLKEDTEILENAIKYIKRHKEGDL